MEVASSFRRLLAAASATLALAAPAAASAAPCASPDNLTRATGAGECLALRTYGAGGARPVLVVVLHGDVSSGGPARYHLPIAETFANAIPGAVVVALVRPGYDDGAGGASSGSNHGRVDQYTAANIDAVAGAVAALKAHHRAARVVLVGHSGGAATAGVILGRHPGVADAAVLVACPCDIARWREGRRPWSRSESPSTYAARVPANTVVSAITGERDDNTQPYLARDYAASLAARGLRATATILPGADHNAAFRDPAVLAEVTRLARGG
ncbi:MAG: prolyl oligopeptidase family serine peptidase [Rhodospirillales bacterium]|nr:prolyl oligopeptidase family serine peptidase [Rhodospirillales bacterium]QQS14246.1 MAG: prolyl oligopeptidase family serine peptidase [Rhodospirillales bacterium]